tara:strand:- start:107 stop:1492 length:1386 start_codon:yes stop_codon:yes gene_type:complete
MRLRQLFEAPKKTAAFAFGRLNPATSGHELLIEEIKRQNADPFLFLSDRASKLPTDPLSSEEKLAWAQKSFNGIAVGLAKSPFLAADRLHKMGYTDLIYLEGEPKMGKVLQAYNGRTMDQHDYNFETLNLVRLTRDPDAEDATGMSASKLRQTVMDNDIEAFKLGVTKSAVPFAEEMFKKLQGLMGVDSIEEKVSNEVAAPKTIKVMKPTNPPKPPDATIPRSRNGYTAKNGTTYVQDKYDEKLIHVSNGGGTYTFDGSRMIKWQTPRIQGLKFIYDYVQNKIYLDSKNEVNIDDGTANIDQLAAYDMKGNLIPDSGSIGVGAGGFSVKQDKSGVSVKNSMFDPFNDVTIVLKSNPAKVQKYGKEKLQKSMDKYLGYLKQSQMGRAMPNMDHEGRLKQLMAIADVKFMKNGQNIPASQAIAGAKEWWASLDKTNQDQNARIAKQRAPQAARQVNPDVGAKG